MINIALVSSGAVFRKNIKLSVVNIGTIFYYFDLNSDTVTVLPLSLLTSSYIYNLFRS